jgi:hypothetical protein
VLGRATDEGLDDVIRKARVLHKVLAAEQHHLRSLRRGRLERIQPVERVFGEETKA